MFDNDVRKFSPNPKIEIAILMDLRMLCSLTSMQILNSGRKTFPHADMFKWMSYGNGNL